MSNINPFERPTEPKSNWQLLMWLIFDYKLLESVEDNYNRKERIVKILQIYFAFIVPFIVICWLILHFGIVLLDMPNLVSDFPFQFFEQYFFLLEKSFLTLAFGLAGGLAGGLGNVLANRLTLGLTLGLTEGLVLGLLSKLAIVVNGLEVGLTLGLVNGLEAVLAIGLLSGLLGGFVGKKFAFVSLVLLFALLFALLFGAAFGLAYGLVVGLAYGLAYHLSFFRLYFYPFYFIKGIVKGFTLTSNPYIKDAGIWLPFWGLQDDLTKQAQQQPKIGEELGNFLLEYRPLQRKLGFHILHAAQSGHWLLNPLKVDNLTFLEIEIEELQPSEKWRKDLETLRKTLVAYEAQSNIGLKKTTFEEFQQQLLDFKQLTLTNENPTWNHYYLGALKVWEIAAAEELRKLAREAKSKEPIATNVFNRGNSLSPSMDKNTFFGRMDLKEKLALEVLTPQALPLLHLVGQRRVGKTSLLKFLPDMLGSRFKVIYYDAQGAIETIPKWFENLRNRINQELNLKEKTAWNAPENWLTAWGELQSYLEAISKETAYKIILAIDEYEALHEEMQGDVAQGKKLLGAFRNFSQHQNQVVFLFVGVKLFSELKAPNWNEYFVHSRTFRVDYLKEADTKKLMQIVDLEYSEAMLDKVFEMTQGYPVLVQSIGYEMVALANTDNRRKMTMADLDLVIDEKVVQETNQNINFFWSQFCETQKEKETVLMILNPNENTYNDLHQNYQGAIRKLMRHEYIIEDKNKQVFRFRVPILEMWLRQYAYME